MAWSKSTFLVDREVNEQHWGLHGLFISSFRNTNGSIRGKDCISAQLGLGTFVMTLLLRDQMNLGGSRMSNVVADFPISV